MQEKLCDGVLFNEIAEMNFRPTTLALVRKSLHQECLAENILELSELLQEGLA